MNRKICIIDDSLPTGHYPAFIDEGQLLDHSILKYLCFNHLDWPEEALKDLILEITGNHTDWTVCGFMNPEFYFKHVENEIFSPEIIIFDWDYSIATVSTEEHLLDILRSTYAIIGIFTGADKKEEIDLILAKSEFLDFSKDRVRLVEKNGVSSVTNIINEVNSRFESHFSFKLGQELKYHALKALDSILVEIGTMSFDEFVWTFGHEKKGNSREISINEFIEILSEKFKNDLMNNNKWSEKSFESSMNENVSNETVRKHWSYRLFRSPIDDIVRVGDIIGRHDGTYNEKFLVVSSDCHLNQFWKKNFGSLTLIPLLASTSTNSKFKERIRLSRNVNSDFLKNVKATSISNLNLFDSLALITSVPVKKEDGSQSFVDYVAFPRSIFSVDIPKPNALDENQVRLQTLFYRHIEEFSGEGRLCLNEPFRSPLIQYCINAITGYGTPDYPNELQNSINGNFNETFKS